MIDVLTHQKLQVVPTERVGPYMKLAEAQVDQVRQVLDKHGVYYWVSESALAVNGGPEITTIYFGNKGDVQAIQQVLDSLN